MRAIAHDGYGPPESLELRNVDTPKIDDASVLIRVHAASLNPLDWHLMRGEPSFMRMIGGKNPIGRIPGADVAGVVEQVGAKVTQLRPGDEVFGTCRGALAEYARSSEKNLVRKPAAIPQGRPVETAGLALPCLADEMTLSPARTPTRSSA